MTGYYLPALPPGIRMLSEVETERLREQHPDLPRTPAECVTCKGTRSFRWKTTQSAEDDESGVEEVVEFDCPCDDQFIAHRYLLHSGLGLHYQRMSWDDAHGIDAPVVDAVLDYSEHIDAYVDAGLGLLLHGKYGTGKTMISALLMKSLLGKGVRGYFTTFHRMLDLFTEGWATDTAKRWFDAQIRHAGVLVIDDVGREFQGRNAVADTAIDHVLRSRIENAKPTVITTNRSPEELGTLYSGNALSMLSECMIVQEFSGTDFRPEQQQRMIYEAKQRITRPVVID